MKIHILLIILRSKNPVQFHTVQQNNPRRNLIKLFSILIRLLQTGLPPDICYFMSLRFSILLTAKGSLEHGQYLIF